MAGTWHHLAARLVDFLTASPLTAAERRSVGELLGAEEQAMFFAQARPDQRHGLRAARFVARNRPERVDLTRAALLHDIGKRHSGLGVMGRSFVTAWVKVGGRPSPRGSLYLGHGGVGADELARLGAEPVVVDFARHHHGTRPESIPEADWGLLQASDHPWPKGLVGERT